MRKCFLKSCWNLLEVAQTIQKFSLLKVKYVRISLKVISALTIEAFFSIEWEASQVFRLHKTVLKPS